MNEGRGAPEPVAHDVQSVGSPRVGVGSNKRWTMATAWAKFEVEMSRSIPLGLIPPLITTNSLAPAAQELTGPG